MKFFKCISNCNENMAHQPKIDKTYTLEEISGIQIKFIESPYYYLLCDFQEVE